MDQVIPVILKMWNWVLICLLFEKGLRLLDLHNISLRSYGSTTQQKSVNKQKQLDAKWTLESKIDSKHNI